MNLKKINFRIITIFLVLLITSCGSDKYDFAGDWVSAENSSQLISIKENGDTYLIEQNGKKYPAQMEGNILALNPEQKAVFNKENANLIINGTEYKRVSGDLFLGNWMTKNLSMNITKVNDKYNVKYTRTYTDYQMEGNKEVDYETIYEKASLNGYYSGSDEGGEFEITLYGQNKIRFYSQTNVTTYDYRLEKSDFVPQSIINFNGIYKGLGDAANTELHIKRTSDNSLKIKVKGAGMDDIIWKGSYKNGFINGTARNVPQIYGIAKASLKFKLNTNLETQGFWSLAGGHDTFEFQKTSEETLAFDNTEVNKLHIKSPNSKDYFVINVTAVKKENNAKKEVEKLKSKGYESGYLWIPDFKSLSGVDFYSVYVGPFYSQSECEKAVEEYRKVDNKAYALLVSQENKRVEIRGIGKVKVIEPYHK